MAKTNWKRLTAVVPIISILNMFLLFGLFMNPVSKEIIFSDILAQNQKLVNVWNTIEPIPSLVSLAPGLLITPAIYSILFAILYESIPGKTKLKKGISYGIIWWATVAVFFELFTPFGLFGEPLHLLAYELFLWFVGLITISLVLSFIYKQKD
jgi:hypothetical protein